MLYGRDNSSFGALEFDEKKMKLFNSFYSKVNKKQKNEQTNILKSNALLHTVSVFSNKKWGLSEIESNKNDFIERFEKCYEVKIIEKEDKNES